MFAPRHLPKAPITEALVDIRVKLPADTELAKLGSIHELIVDQYPKRKERRRREFSFEFKEGEPPNQAATDITDGYFYISRDDKQVVQVRLDGFTFSRLKPYEKWETMRDEARRLWQLYVKFASPEFITRIAVRYINHLNIPLPFLDFAEYLTAPPIVPPDLPQGVASFLTRVVIIEPNLGASAAITQALEPQAQKDFITIILDIDVFKQTQFALDSNETWDLLEDFRHFKNKIFFGSVTERTLRLCE
jgi:uncharacterized protein (TIGR04255 family)